MYGARNNPVETFKTTLNEFLWRLGLYNRKQVDRMREVTALRPLVLQIETTNACNAACVFCAYPSMKRKKGVMPIELFRKVVTDYCAMGGGAVTLTPIVGDGLLDPYLMERLDILESFSDIRQMTMTTNAIALGRYTDEQVRRLLAVLDCIQISIGGLDAEGYAAMYGVDHFTAVQEAMERLLALRDSVQNSASITFAFRTNDWQFEMRNKEKLGKFKDRGVFISHLWSYANYAGQRDSNDSVSLSVIANQESKPVTCVYPQMHMAVAWNGSVTACSCTDLECEKLLLGNAEQETIEQIWNGKRRTAILGSFGKGAPAEICRLCSAYQPDEHFFSQQFFKDIEYGEQLPQDFFRNVMT